MLTSCLENEAELLAQTAGNISLGETGRAKVQDLRAGTEQEDHTRGRIGQRLKPTVISEMLTQGHEEI